MRGRTRALPRPFVTKTATRTRTPTYLEVMKTLAMCALVLSLAVSAVAGEKKDGISISFDSDDSRTRLASRYDVRDARVAVTTRSGSAVLLVTSDVVAVQLSDDALA